jgi:hypothetical protein
MAVAVDTSGSVPDSDLSRFFSEIHGMWRQGAEIVVIECDATVQKVWDYKGHFPDRVAEAWCLLHPPQFHQLKLSRSLGPQCAMVAPSRPPSLAIAPPCSNQSW